MSDLIAWQAIATLLTIAGIVLAAIKSWEETDEEGNTGNGRHNRVYYNHMGR